ncbi:MAG: hypothetical protein RLZ12_226 [Bacillota bacterium]
MKNQICCLPQRVLKKINPCFFLECRREPKSCQMVEDTMSGSFRLDSFTRSLVIWEVVDVPEKSSGSLSFLLTTGDLPVRVIVNDDYYFLIEKDQTIAKTFTVLYKVVVEYTGLDFNNKTELAAISTVSSGEYCIAYHYSVDC